MPDNSTPASTDVPEAGLPIDTIELAALRMIVEGTAQSTGEDFFRSLVRNLSIVTGVTNAFIAEFADSKARVRTLAFWMNGEFVQNQEWELAGTPCEVVLWGKLCHYPENVGQLFPSAAGLTSVGF